MGAGKVIHYTHIIAVELPLLSDSMICHSKLPLLQAAFVLKNIYSVDRGVCRTRAHPCYLQWGSDSLNIHAHRPVQARK